MLNAAVFALISPGKGAAAADLLHAVCNAGGGFEIGEDDTGARRTVISYGLQAIFRKYRLI